MIKFTLDSVLVHLIRDKHPEWLISKDTEIQMFQDVGERVLQVPAQPPSPVDWWEPSSPQNAKPGVMILPEPIDWNQSLDLPNVGPDIEIQFKRAIVLRKFEWEISGRFFIDDCWRNRNWSVMVGYDPQTNILYIGGTE
jgi:hypothetical protein